MPSRKDDDSYSSGAMGFDPLGDDDEVLARTLYHSGNRPLAEPPSTDTPPVDSAAVSARVASTTKPPAPKKVATSTDTPPVANAPAPRKKPAPKPTRRRRDKTPQHYKVLSISLYNEDIEQMDAFVKELKAQGFTRMNRSALIRFALDQVDISKMPRGY